MHELQTKYKKYFFNELWDLSTWLLSRMIRFMSVENDDEKLCTLDVVS
jgi:hypothetical protein